LAACGFPDFLAGSHSKEKDTMDESQQPGTPEISHGDLIDLLNEDLSRQSQAIMICEICCEMINADRNTAGHLRKQIQLELQHAFIIAEQIHSLGGRPSIQAKLVKSSDHTEKMLRFKLEKETEAILNYRERVDQCKALGEHTTAERIYEILLRKQQWLEVGLAIVLHKDPPTSRDLL
jgi:bacterioferritin